MNQPVLIGSVAVLAVALAAAPLAAADAFPMVRTVESQPLLAQLTRLADASAAMGEPLPKDVIDGLAALKSETDAARVAAGAQKLLDPLCVFAVEFAADGKVRAVPAGKPLDLVEQGWRTYPIKVCNPANREERLWFDSPNAQMVPRGPAEAVAERWLDLSEVTSQPLLPALSGLELEYRLLQVFTRDAGDRSASLQIGTVPVRSQRGARPAGETATVSLTATGRPSTVVTFQVREVDGSPTMAAFEIRDAQGRIYPAQSKRLAPDFFFHPQVYRETGETVRLPAGKFTVRCSRGPESVPEVKSLEVGSSPGTFSYQVKRWTDPAKTGWYSGDHHIHAAGCAHYEKPTEGVHPPDMIRHCLGEDLKIGACLTWGPCFDYQKRFFSGRPDPVSRPPYLLRYDVEVSGFGSHVSGHLCLLRLKEQMYPGGESKHHWPTLGLNTLKWAQRQGAVCGPAHSAAGLTQFVGRVEGTEDGPLNLPNYRIPLYNGIGANEFIMNITHDVEGPGGIRVPAVDFISTMDTDRVAEWNMWYHALNCGFRTRASGETDFPCISGQRVGMGRVYVKLDGPVEYEQWCQGIEDGRSYVSDGTVHLMGLTATSADQKAELGEKGSELKLGGNAKVKLATKAAARRDGGKPVKVELIVNGRSVQQQELPGDGQTRELSFEADIGQSSWAAVRVFPSAHTNPIFVLVNDKPIRASKASVEWCLRGVDQCWSQKRRTYASAEMADAEAAYEHARQVYRRLLSETTAP